MKNYKALKLDYFDKKYKSTTSIIIKGYDENAMFNILYEIRDLFDEQNIKYIVYAKEKKLFASWKRLHIINDLM